MSFCLQMRRQMCGKRVDILCDKIERTVDPSRPVHILSVFSLLKDVNSTHIIASDGSAFSGVKAGETHHFNHFDLVLCLSLQILFGYLRSVRLFLII